MARFDRNNGNVLSPWRLALALALLVSQAQALYFYLNVRLESTCRALGVRAEAQIRMDRLERRGVSSKNSHKIRLS